MVCFSLFVPFALFAVQEIQKEWLLEFNREMHENREQKGSVRCRLKAVRGRDQGEVSPPLQGGDREP